MGKLFNPKTLVGFRQHLRHNMTSPERRLWFNLNKQQLGVKFRRQHGIGNFIVDFYCPSMKLIIEIDGHSHFTAEAQHADQLRDCYLESLNLTVLRFTNLQITSEIDAVLASIKQTLEQIQKRQTPHQPSP